MGQVLQTVLATSYHGAASAGLCLVPSYCLCHLPLPALDFLAPWLQLLPLHGLPPLWQMTVISPLWKQKGTPSDPATYRGLSALHPLGKLLALSYLRYLDDKTHCQGWLAK